MKRKIYLTTLLLAFYVSNSFSQINLSDLFLNNQIDTNYSSLTSSLTNNSLLKKIDDFNYKLKTTSLDPLLINLPSFIDTNLFEIKNKEIFPDSTIFKIILTEIVNISPPNNSIYEIEVNRYFNDVKNAHYIYNLILEKLIERIETKPKKNFDINTGSGIVEITSTGMLFEIEENDKVILYLDLSYLSNNVFNLRLNYSAYNYK